MASYLTLNLLTLRLKLLAQNPFIPQNCLCRKKYPIKNSIYQEFYSQQCKNEENWIRPKYPKSTFFFWPDICIYVYYYIQQIPLLVFGCCLPNIYFTFQERQAPILYTATIESEIKKQRQKLWGEKKKILQFLLVLPFELPLMKIPNLSKTKTY